MTVKMIKDEDGNYVPEECCSFSRNFETGNIEIDDVDLPCGADCDDQCQNCVIQRIMNEYTEQKKDDWCAKWKTKEVPEWKARMMNTFLAGH